jgi:outer membrane protein W
MRKLLMLSLIALLVPMTSQAQVTLGLRVGYAPAMGDAAKDAPLKDVVSSQIPIQLDALYRITPDIGAGLYFSYGIAQLNSDVKDFCDASGVSCSASNMRLGVQGRYTFNSLKAPMVPWAGVGFGYEWSTIKGSAGGVSADATTTGFEFLNLQVGGDYKVNDQFAIGPYVQFSIGQYSAVEGEDITDKGMHEWLGFGIAGKFDL